MSDHCWHSATLQHAQIIGGPHFGEHHRDVTCCFCEKTECRTGVVVKDPRHGPFNPDHRVVYRHVVAESCPLRPSEREEEVVG